MEKVDNHNYPRAYDHLFDIRLLGIQHGDKSDSQKVPRLI